MTRRRRQFSPEFGEEAVRMVLDGPRSIAAVAREFGMNRHWINTRKAACPETPRHPTSERSPSRERPGPRAAAPAKRTTPRHPLRTPPKEQPPWERPRVLTERSGPRERSSPQGLPSWGRGCS
ncbi:transposase [Streptosporangium sp. NPDC020145]|uniref:transposase n=1 Tax=Streptosporangium sp. NPDC020145 TaxID=3154694 RepID=UPI003427AB0A